MWNAVLQTPHVTTILCYYFALMPFSPAARRELKEELARIEGERVRLGIRANAIRQILEGEEQEQRSLLMLDEPPAPEPLPLVAVPPRPGTFKASVAAVIRERPGIRVPQITGVLRNRGWLPSGTTDLGHRVYNEVWRMLQRNEVRKDETGGLELAS